MTTQISELPEVDLESPEFLEDPEACVASIRDGVGLARTQRGLDVLSYAALAAMMRDTRLGDSMVARLNACDIHEGPAFDIVSGNLISQEGESHTRQRQAAAPWFKPGRAEELRADVRGWVDSWLEEMADAERFDFRDAVTRPLPAALFAKIVGAPQSDGEAIRDLAETILLTVQGPHPDEREEIERASLELGDYVRELTAQKRKRPGDDLVSTLLEAERRGEMSEQEIVNVVFTVLIASMDTTDSQLCGNLATLAEHQDQWQLLRRDPDRVPLAVNELVRFHQTAMSPTVRRVTEPLEFLGVEVTPEVEIWGCAFAANKDPLAFDNPRSLDFSREWTRMPLSFGIGVHSCLGRVFALIEMEELLRSMLDRWEEFEVDSAWYGSPTLLLPERIEVSPSPVGALG